MLLSTVTGSAAAGPTARLGPLFDRLERAHRTAFRWPSRRSRSWRTPGRSSSYRGGRPAVRGGGIEGQGDHLPQRDAIPAVLTRALDQADSIADALQLYQRNRVDRTVRIVNQSTANRTLFHLRTVDEIRASFAKRDEGADRNGWLYSYNPLTVTLV